MLITTSCNRRESGAVVIPFLQIIVPIFLHKSLPWIGFSYSLPSMSNRKLTMPWVAGYY